VPAGALRDEAGVAYVLVIDGERLSRRPVRPGLVSDDGARVEIREGLAVGMRVVSAKLDTLADGMAVRVAPAATAAAR
jgi:multidrug efflux pump subunit AcrA (membrane-fusion protein)